MNIFNEFYSVSFWSGVFASIIASALVGILVFLYKRIKYHISGGKNIYNISGYWISAFSFEEYKTYEIIKVSVKEGNIFIKYQSYRLTNDNNTFASYIGEGHGIFKSGYIFCPYIDFCNNTQAGTYTLKVSLQKRNMSLVGYYLQTHSEEILDGFAKGVVVFSPIDINKIFNSFNRAKLFLKFKLNKLFFKDKKELQNFVQNKYISVVLNENTEVFTKFSRISNFIQNSSLN